MVNLGDSTPKGLVENCAFRAELLSACWEDSALARGVKGRCAEDLLWWVNLALWTYDPRKLRAAQNPHIPFITWPFQDETLLTLDKHIGLDDVGIEKSRDMGASWMCLVAFLHQWQFRDGRAFMVVSRNERLVDAPSDPDTLFWKLDYLLARQPAFLVPPYDRTKLHLVNRESGSVIDGASTTADVGRGGRRTAFLLDEYGAFEGPDSEAVDAATASNTESRIFNSTYKGTVGAFYKQMQRQDIVKISLHWTKHPEKAVGLVTDGRGKPSSPWYVKMCQRMVTPALIAQELDMDPAGAESPLFPIDLIEKILREDVRSPAWRGRLLFEHDPKEAKLSEDWHGDLQLWLRPDALGRIAAGEQFAIGLDVSFGTGATNSAASVVSKRTREKVGELVRPDLSPERWADLVTALGWLFNEAVLIWEQNGPGNILAKRLQALGYRNVYYRRDELSLDQKISKGMVPGWHASPINKDLLFGSYIGALSRGFFVNRSREAVIECRHYRYMPDGHVGNARAVAVLDPSGAKRNHGDRPTADALANHLLGPEPETVKAERERTIFDVPEQPKFGGADWRMRQWLDEQQKEEQSPWSSSKEALAGWEDKPESLSGW